MAFGRRAHPELIAAKIHRALDHLQEAQNLVGRALQELSPIVGALPVYTRGHRLYDLVHAYWYKVSALKEKVQKLRLDNEPSGADFAAYGLPAPAPADEVQ